MPAKHAQYYISGVENAGLMGMLDYRGIAVSAGSACSTGKTSLPMF